MAEDTLRFELDASDLIRAAGALAAASRASGSFTGRGGLSLSGAGGVGLWSRMTLVSVGFSAMATALAAATAAVGRFGQQLATVGAVALAGGGTGSQAAGLASTLAAAGIDAGQIPGIASRVRSLRGGGRAAAELGFQPSQEVAPGLNELRGLSDVVNQILSPLTSESQAYVKAKLAELEVLLPLRQVQKDHAADLAKTEELQKRISDPQTLRNAADFSYQMQNIQRSFGLLGQSIAQFFLPALSLLSEIASQAAKGLALVFDQLARIPGSGFKAGDAAAAAAQQQAQATKDNTEALKAMKKEYANAGPAAAGAMPAGLHGQALQKYLEKRAFELGAFRP